MKTQHGDDVVFQFAPKQAAVIAVFLGTELDTVYAAPPEALFTALIAKLSMPQPRSVNLRQLYLILVIWAVVVWAVVLLVIGISHL